MEKRTNSAGVCDKVMKEMLNSLDKDKVYTSLRRGNTSNPKEFNEMLLSLLERILNKYEDDVKKYNKFIGDAEKTNLEEKIITELESIFKEKLVSLGKEIVSSAQSQVRAELERFREPQNAIDDVVRAYMDRFNDACPNNSNVHVKFIDLLHDQREELLRELQRITREEANNMGNNGGFIMSALTTSVKLVVATATGDFTAIVEVIGAFL